MVRGQEAKNILGNSLLQIFAGSFVDGKTVRIPIREPSTNEIVEVKIQMTAAKDSLRGTPVEDKPIIKDLTKFNINGPTEEELDELKKFMKSIGLEVL